MIEYNGLKFAENEKEFVDSLFEHGKTCSGYAKRYKRKVMFYDHNKKHIACVNRFGCLSGATEKEIEGKKVIWYSYCMPDIMKRTPLLDEYDFIKSLAVKSEFKNETEYWYK